MKVADTKGLNFPLFRVYCRVCCGLFVLVFFVLSGFSSRAAGEDRVVFSNSITPLPTTTGITKKALTTSNMSETMDFAIGLPMRNREELDLRLAHGETISADEMDRLFLPLQSDYDAVKAWLISEGMTIRMEDSSRLSVFARGTVQQVQTSLQTTVVSVTTDGVAYLAASTAPSLPSKIAGKVLGINGLQPFRQKRKHSIRPQTSNKAPFLINEILGAFNAKNLGVTGTGQTIAILIDTTPATSDLTAFWKNNSVTRTGTVTTINVNNNTLPPVNGEESLDVEWTSGIAPGANIRIYACGSLSDANLDAGFAKIINELSTYPIHQLSISLGENESDTSASEVKTDSNYLATLASRGVSTFVSSGDDGSTPNGNGASTGPLGVEYYTSDPNVTSVGGTSLVLTSAGARSTETVWSGSGGGISTLFAKPSWQKGTGVPTGTKRYVPDVSLPADPNTGAYVYLSGKVQTIGGTSWSAPTWAGFCALINQARANVSNPSIGLLNPSVYPLIGTTNFYDITSGTNANGSTANGKYVATAGYDECTGIGSPNMGVLLPTLTGNNSTTPTITSFSPTSGVVGTSVVIAGTNFSSVTSLKFNGVAASTYTVNSTTQITATVPTGATTGAISLVASGGSATSSTSFAVTDPNAPTLNSFAPTSGPVGTSVTISGTNFINVSAVTFGGVSATTYTVNSTTQITATVPSGASSGVVIVTTPNGTATSPSSFNVTSVSTGTVVISQVYGGGGGSTATYKNDFIELFNPGTTSIDLSAYSVQYASATGVSFTATSLPSGATILAKHYYLIQESSGTTGAALPTADATGTLAMSATDGKVALVSSKTAISSRTTSSVVDYVGYGSKANDYEGSAPTATLSATTAALRKNGGTIDTNDNSNDFTVSAPTPRNSSNSNTSTVTAPDLLIAKSHATNFTQADTGDVYTITVSNSGNASTSGTVSVVDNLPSGLTATAMAGTGWTINFSTLTATRADVLAANASYPPVTVTVNVAANAPASVINTASVSGGGETNTDNDTANDTTAIVALTPSQSWRYQYFGTTENSGVAADSYVYAGDGLTNLVKYTLNLSPLVPASSPVELDVSTGYLRLSTPLNPNATDVTIAVEVNNTDLGTTSNWTSNGTMIDQKTSTFFQGHDTTPISDSAEQFIRLRISRP